MLAKTPETGAVVLPTHQVVATFQIRKHKYACPKIFHTDAFLSVRIFSANKSGTKAKSNIREVCNGGQPSHKSNPDRMLQKRI